MKVLITREIPQAGITLLKRHPEIEIIYKKGPPLTDRQMKKAVKDIDALIPVIPDQITKEVITSAGKSLKLIAAYSVGYDHIDVAFATKRGVYVANTPGNLTEAVSEHAFALIMDAARRISEGDRFCRNKKYKYWDPMLMIGPKLRGKTLGIIGFGRIGQQLARIAHLGFGMEILYSDPIAHFEGEALLDAKKVELNKLLENSDFVSVNCNLTEETKHLIGEQEFRKMKPTAYLINTARGPIVNEEALACALKENIIAGAGLDVFENEPKINHTLLKLENVVLTPHIASATFEARIEMATMTAENVIDVLINNKPPRYLVNKDLISSLA